MRTARLIFVMVVAILVAAGVSTTFAFHSGGVAECGGCHSMHSPVSADSLLIRADASSTCLDCHQHLGDTRASSYHISTDPADIAIYGHPLQYSPGGDFSWTKVTFNDVVRGEPYVEEGHEHGHNIIASEFGYDVDPVNGTAPGGTYTAGNLTCIGCHDQHSPYRRLSTGALALSGAPIMASGSYNTSPGNSASNLIPAGRAVGVYRLLRGADNPDPVGAADFPGIPIAVAPSSYNRSETTAAGQTRVAYGISITGGYTTWGQWCGTCHADMHSTGNNVHPIDTSMSALNGNYNSYVSSGVMTGTSTTSFLSLVPFAKNSADFTVLGPLAQNNGSGDSRFGPSDGDQVMCLSCHRAHASAFPWAVRWQMENEFITWDCTTLGRAVWPSTETTPDRAQMNLGRSLEHIQAAGYYDRPASLFGQGYQRVLCNKCHAKD